MYFQWSTGIPGYQGPPQDACRACWPLCRKCGNYFATTAEERGAQERALERHKRARTLKALPQKLPNLCPECRVEKRAPERVGVVVFRRKTG